MICDLTMSDDTSSQLHLRVPSGCVFPILGHSLSPYARARGSRRFEWEKPSRLIRPNVLLVLNLAKQLRHELKGVRR